MVFLSALIILITKVYNILCYNADFREIERYNLKTKGYLVDNDGSENKESIQTFYDMQPHSRSEPNMKSDKYNGIQIIPPSIAIDGEKYGKNEYSHYPFYMYDNALYINELKNLFKRNNQANFIPRRNRKTSRLDQDELRDEIVFSEGQPSWGITNLANNKYDASYFVPFFDSLVGLLEGLNPKLLRLLKEDIDQRLYKADKNKLYQQYKFLGNLTHHYKPTFKQEHSSWPLPMSYNFAVPASVSKEANDELFITVPRKGISDWPASSRASEARILKNVFKNLNYHEGIMSTPSSMIESLTTSPAINITPIYVNNDSSGIKLESSFTISSNFAGNNNQPEKNTVTKNILETTRTSNAEIEGSAKPQLRSLKPSYTPLSRNLILKRLMFSDSCKGNKAIAGKKIDSINANPEKIIKQLIPNIPRNVLLDVLKRRSNPDLLIDKLIENILTIAINTRESFSSAKQNELTTEIKYEFIKNVDRNELASRNAKFHEETYTESSPLRGQHHSAVAEGSTNPSFDSSSNVMKQSEKDLFPYADKNIQYSDYAEEDYNDVYETPSLNRHDTYHDVNIGIENVEKVEPFKSSNKPIFNLFKRPYLLAQNKNKFDKPIVNYRYLPKKSLGPSTDLSE